MAKRCAGVFNKIVIAALLLVPFNVLAQDPGLPCDGEDPIAGECPVPLDSWIIVLALAALSFGVWYLHKNQKRFFVQ